MLPVYASVASVDGLQMSTTEIKADLRDLYIVGAKQVELTGGKKAIIIFVPYRYTPTTQAKVLVYTLRMTL